MKKAGIIRSMKGSDAYKDAWSRPLLIGIFFLTGAAGLIYEVIWARLLILVFGATVFAISTVLVSFMAGLALGSLVFGRLSDRVKNPLLLYAVLQAGIASAAVLMPFAFRATGALFVWFYQATTPGFISLSMIRFGVSFTVLLVPTFLMGGTLPALVKFFAGSLKSLGRRVAVLYAVNTFGAVCGAFFTGFVLIGTLGIIGSTLIGAFLNLVGAVVPLLLVRRLRYSLPAPGKKPDHPKYYSRAVSVYILWAITLSGFAALAYEVTWTRALSVVLSSTTYSFTAMLTAFLFGIGLGSFIFARKIDGWRNPLFAFGIVELGIGISSIYVLVVMGNLPGILESLFRHVQGAWLRTIASGYILSFIVMLVTTLLMGMTIPLAVKIHSSSLRSVGRSLGNIYSCNTLGCILGSLIAGFALIPTVGIRGTNASMSVLSLTIGTTAVALSSPVPRRVRILILAAGLGIAALATPYSVLRYRPVVPLSVGRDFKVLYYEEDVGGVVTVVRNLKSGEKMCFVDNSWVCGTSYNALKTVRMLGHLPVLACENPRRVLVIGYGMGVTSRAVSLHPQVEEIHIAELAPGVVDASYYFREVNHDVLSDPRVDLNVEDGRNYLLLSNEKYDCITCDPTHPVLGSGALYTKEYFELCRERLNPEGVVTQYLPLHMLSFGDLRSIARTFNQVFPNSSLWLTFSHCVMLGKNTPIEIDFQDLDSRLNQPGVSEDLAESDLGTSVEFVSSFLMGSSEMRRMVGDAPLNTDYSPVVEFSGARSFRETWASNLDSLIRYRQSVQSLLVNVPEEINSLILNHSLARGESLRGRICHYDGDYEEALLHYDKALSYVSDHKETLILAAHAYNNLRARTYDE